MKKTMLLMAVSIMISAFMLTACNSKKTETSSDTTESKAEKNKQTALASVMAFNAHDADAMLKDITTDAVDYGDGSGPVVKGADSIKMFLKAWFAAFPDVKGENLMSLTDDGSHVAVIGDW